jgi:hypothetical protein
MPITWQMSRKWIDVTFSDPYTISESETVAPSCSLEPQRWRCRHRGTVSRISRRRGHTALSRWSDALQGTPPVHRREWHSCQGRSLRGHPPPRARALQSERPEDRRDPPFVQDAVPTGVGFSRRLPIQRSGVFLIDDGICGTKRAGFLAASVLRWILDGCVTVERQPCASRLQAARARSATQS